MIKTKCRSEHSGLLFCQLKARCEAGALKARDLTTAGMTVFSRCRKTPGFTVRSTPSARAGRRAEITVHAGLACH